MFQQNFLRCILYKFYLMVLSLSRQDLNILWEKFTVSDGYMIQFSNRGFLTRRMVKKIYGFEMSHGLLMRGTVHIEMDPEKLEE